MASDGSSGDKENVMTVGWEIVDKNKDPLVEHLGLAFGKASSFRAKGYGLSFLAWFLRHGKAIHKQRFNVRLKYISTTKEYLNK
eukprot:10303676-Ditylum_brightwellii.AAC.1